MLHTVHHTDRIRGRVSAALGVFRDRATAALGFRGRVSAALGVCRGRATAALGFRGRATAALGDYR